MPQPGARRSTRSDGADTHQRLLEAAVDVLTEDGYAGATSRAIAEAAGCNQALVFYHHGSLNDLLLAALDASNEAALARYRSRLAEADSLADLTATLRELYPADHSSGHIGLLAQMVAGGIVDEGLGRRVADRVDPWIELTEDALQHGLPGPLAARMPLAQLAYLIVATALGAELLATLTGTHARNQQLLDTLDRGAILTLLRRQQ